MFTSSASPEELESFAARSASANDNLRALLARVKNDYADFVAGTSWGSLHADDLLAGFGSYLDWNDRDVQWARTVARAFREAGGTGSLPLPDAALEAYLRVSGLGGERPDLALEGPETFGTTSTSGFADDPVNTSNGNFVELECDLVFEGLASHLSWNRTYNSRSSSRGAFGPGWASRADIELTLGPPGASLVMADGRQITFPRLGDGFDKATMAAAWLTGTESGYLVTFNNGAFYSLTPEGRLSTMQSGPGTCLQFTYDRDRLVKIAHEQGREIRLSWEADRVVAATSDDGRRVHYGYDGAGRLTSVNGPGGRRTYTIGDDGRLATIIDADGAVEVSNTYDASGRISSQTSSFGRRSTYTYLRGRITVIRDQENRSNIWISDPYGRMIGVVDSDGNRQSIAYDAHGNPILITERSGVVTIQEFDGRDRLIRRVPPCGPAVSFNYDEQDRLVQVSAVGGGTARYEYGTAERIPRRIVDEEGGVSNLDVRDGLIREFVDPDGVSTSFGYDSFGDVISITNGEGGTARCERDRAGRILAVISPEGRRTEYKYDKRGLLVEEQRPDGGVWEFEHTAGGRLVAVTDPLGGRSTAKYGKHGQALTNALGHTSINTFDDFGNLTDVVLPDQSRWRLAYDGLSRLTTITNPMGATWTKGYDVNGNLVVTTDPTGLAVKMELDDQGRVTRVSDGGAGIGVRYDPLGRAVAEVGEDGNETHVRYDRCGRVVEVIDSEGSSKKYDRTPAGRVSRIINPSGSSKTLEYDKCGRPSALLESNGARTLYSYTLDGQIAEVTSPIGDAIRFSWDSEGRLCECAVPGFGVATREYDRCGRLVLAADGLLGRRRFEYDAIGNLIGAIDANGNTTTFLHDAGGRRIETWDPLGGSLRRTFDLAGNILTQTDQLGRVTTATYDLAGRPIERLEPDGRVFAWAYDQFGRVSTRLATDVLGTTQEMSIECAPVDRRLRLTCGNITNELWWDSTGKLTRQRRDGVEMQWEYNADGLLSALVNPDGTRTTYEYDSAARVVRVHHPAIGVAKLTRDLAGCLIRLQARGLDATWSWENGHVVRQDVSRDGVTSAVLVVRDADDRIASLTIDDTVTNYAYDPAGQLTDIDTDGHRTRLAYDSAGRLVREILASGQSRSYAYDAASQLMSITNQDGSITMFRYDEAGRRIGEMVTHDDGTTVVEREYTWDPQGRLSAIRIVTPNRISTRSLGVDALGSLARIDSNELMWDIAATYRPLLKIGDTILIRVGPATAFVSPRGLEWLAPDGLGRATPASGAFDPSNPWGTCSDTNGSGPGSIGDAMMGQFAWLWARVYDSATKSFISPDPLPPISGTAYSGNPFAYAGNNPLTFGDPLGMRPVTDSELRGYRDQMAITPWQMDLAQGIFAVGGGLMNLGANASLTGAYQTTWTRAFGGSAFMSYKNALNGPFKVNGFWNNVNKSQFGQIFGSVGTGLGWVSILGDAVEIHKAETAQDLTFRTIQTGADLLKLSKHPVAILSGMAVSSVSMAVEEGFKVDWSAEGLQQTFDFIGQEGLGVVGESFVDACKSVFGKVFNTVL